MILAHYLHRLPADYDLDQMRTRARVRGPAWDGIPDLHFKAFLLRERGVHGAHGNSYGALYLWQHDRALRDFLLQGRFDGVIETFGRPIVDVSTALDARRGPGRHARFLSLEEVAIGPEAELREALLAAVDDNQARSTEAGTVVSAVGIDMRRWTLTRVRVTEQAPAEADSAARMIFQIVYLASTLLQELPG